ncbi:hypothetical protein E9840_05860 [Tissierella creatinini]|nr:hypothetical protein E9840_05860 [Tissierella creatinini]TJX63943.1 hypothetical protein E8P77_13455 [Soehngenia saccharolytica]
MGGFNMAKIEFQIDDKILNEAEKVLHLLGMDIEMAVNIYLRRIALEKGLPMFMTWNESKEQEAETIEDFVSSYDEESKVSTQVNKITPEMVDEVWNAFLRYNSGAGEINPLSKEISSKTGMNQSSAFIYLNILTNLVNGDPNTRLLKFKDLEYLMSKIQLELGDNKFQKALKSLMLSVPYWREKIPGAFSDKIEAYCKKHM